FPLSFFFMLPPPPTSTLFPYTTLFRSPSSCLAAVRLPVRDLRGLQHRSRGAAVDDAATRRRVALPGSLGTQQRHVPIRSGRRTGDRKSTRLNSSHVAISYAVFGLKKKN